MRLLAHRFVDLWLGAGFSATARALIVLTGVQIAHLAAGPALLILVGRGTLGPAVRFSLVGMSGTLILSTILISLWGFTGALYGTSVSVLGATVYLILLFHQETGFSMRRLLRIYFEPVILGLCLAALAGYLVPFRRLYWPGMIVSAVAIVGADGVGLLLLRYFDAFDLRIVERFLPVPDVMRRSWFFS